MEFRKEVRVMTEVIWTGGKNETFHGVIIEPESKVERDFFRESRTKYWMSQGALSVNVWVEGE